MDDIEKDILINFIEKHSGLTRTERYLVDQLHHSQNQVRKVKEIEESLLKPFHIAPFKKKEGAYLKPDSLNMLFEIILKIYLDKNFFVLPFMKKNSKLLSVRVSIDGTPDVYKRAHSENFEIISFQFLDVIHPQHPKHVIPIAILKEKESSEVLKELESSLNLNSFINWIEVKTIKLDKETFTFEVFFSADWMGHVAESCLAQPNQITVEKPCCTWCMKSRKELKEMFLNGICYCEIKNEKNGIFQFFPKKKLYCWGHAVARLLTNCLNNFYELYENYDRKKGNFARAISSILGKWEPGWSIAWSEAKLFLLTLKWKRIPKDLFSKMQVHYAYKKLHSICFFSVDELFELFMEILTIFLVFAYIRWPTTLDLYYLAKAQLAFQWASKIMDKKLPPTSHFMMGHARDLALDVGTAYTTLHEGVEKKHHSIKKNAQHTFKGDIEDNQSNRYVVLMKDLLIKAVLQVFDEEGPSEDEAHHWTSLELLIQSNFNQINFFF